MTRDIPVESLFDISNGMIRRGDEVHNPSNWICCSECRAECPADAETCFNCGSKLVE